MVLILFNGKLSYANTVNDESLIMMNMTAGYFGISDSQDKPLRFGLEYRFKAFSKWQLIPAAGLVLMEDGAYFAYTDLRHDFWLNKDWVIIPSFGLGFFKESKSLKLGNELEFRSGVELAYRFYKNYRIGIAIFHLSNGSISDINPGTEVLVLSFARS